MSAATLGAEVRAARLRAGLTQAQCAESSGMPRPNWARLEGGGRDDGASVATLVAVAQALSCYVVIAPDGSVTLSPVG